MWAWTRLPGCTKAPGARVAAAAVAATLCFPAEAADDVASAPENSPAAIVLEVPRGHASEVQEVRLTSDGRQAVSRDRDGTVILWDLERAQSRGALPFSAEQIDVARDVPLLLALRHRSGTHELLFFDLEAQAVVDRVDARRLLHDGQYSLFVSHAHLFPDGKRVLVRTNSDYLGVLDRATLNVRTLARKSDVGGEIDDAVVAGERVAAFVKLEENRFQVATWNAGGALIARTPLPCPARRQCSAQGIFADGLRLLFKLYAWGSEDNSYGHVIGAIDVASGRLLWTHEGEGAIVGVPTPESFRILEIAENKTQAIDPATGQVDPRHMPGTELLTEGMRTTGMSPVRGGAVTMDKERLALFRIANGTLAQTTLAAPAASITALAATAGTREVAVLRGRDILHVDVMTGAVRLTQLADLTNAVATQAFSADGRRLYRAGLDPAKGSDPRQLHVEAVDVASGMPVWRHRLPVSENAQSDRIRIFAEGSFVGVAWKVSEDEGPFSVAALDAATGRLAWTAAVPLKVEGYESINAITLPDAPNLWFIDRQGQVAELAWANGAVRMSRHVPDVSLLYETVTIGRDGRVVVTGNGGIGQKVVRVIDWQRRTATDAILAIEEGNLLARGGTDRVLFGSDLGEVIEFDAAHEVMSGSFAPHAGRVAGLASVAEEDRVVSVSHDGVLHISERSSGRLFARIFLGDGDDHLVATPQSFFSGSGPAARSVSARVGGRMIAPSGLQMRDLHRPDLLRAALAGDRVSRLDEERRVVVEKWRQDSANPTVALLEPDDNTVVATGLLRVSAMVHPGANGIGRITIARNGQPVLVADVPPGLAAFSEQRLLHEIVLEPGANRIELIATDQAGTGTSAVSGVTVRSTRGAPERLRLHVITVAAGETPGRAARADRLGESLRRVAAVPFHAVVRHHVPFDDAERQFARVAAAIDPADLAIILFEGTLPAGGADDLAAIWSAAPDGSRTLSDIVALAARIPARKSLLAADLARPPDGQLLASRGLDDVAMLDAFLRASGRIMFLHAAEAERPGALAEAFDAALKAWDREGSGALTVTHWVELARQQLERRQAAAVERTLFQQTFVFGEDFPVARAAARAPRAPRDVEPTHVLVRSACASDPPTPCARPLQPGFLVRLGAREGDMAWVSRDGEDLGRVPIEVLAPLRP